MSLFSRVITTLTAFFCVLCTHSAFAISKLEFNLPQGVTPMSQDIYALHMAAFYICCAIGIVVFGVLIYCLIKFRHSKGAVADKHFHEHLGIELTWTIIPFILLIILAVPATIVLDRIHDTNESELDIKVTGYQWKWQYEYLNQGIRFFSNLSTPQDQINNKAPKGPWYLLEVDHPLVVPIHEKIRLLVTANDVIHSWWVPDLGVKQDAVPGYINQNWMYIEKPGIYRGQCAELCGAYHAFMPIVVEAVTPDQFDAWVQKQNKQLQTMAITAEKNIPVKQLMTNGEKYYGTYCATCHQANGQGLPPSFPAIKGSKIATGPLSQHLNIVLNGVKGTAMQAFGSQLDDATLAAIITYQRNAWGNDQININNKQAVIVQPLEIKKARG